MREAHYTVGTYPKTGYGGSPFASSQEATVSPVTRLEELTAMVIDDDTAIVTVLTRILRRSFRRVRGISSGGDAIESFSLEPVDVVICDLHLGDADGLDVCAAITHLCLKEGRLKPFMILLHGSLDPGASPERMEECGIDMVAQKPIDLETLLSVARGAARRCRRTSS